MVEKWQGDMRERDLAEKRRVAPGWLDVEEGGRLLVPQRKAGQISGGTMGDGAVPALDGMRDLAAGMNVLELEGTTSREGEELDRAFGGPT